MDSLTIGNKMNFPYHGLNPDLVNQYGSSMVSFNSNSMPNGPHTIVRGGKNKKISRYYNMKIKSKKYGRGRGRTRRTRTRNRRARRSRRYHMKGGMVNYPAGDTQFNNNNGSLSNTYYLGGPLSAGNSALANPPPFYKVAGDVDNLNHNALNAFGNSGAGAGFASRGWY